MFLYSAYQQYTNKDIIEFLQKQGLEVKEERGNRIFPCTDNALSGISEKLCHSLQVKVLYLGNYIHQFYFSAALSG